MKEINLFMDESGDLGLKGDRYFLICALDVKSENIITLTRRSKRVIYKFKEKYNYNEKSEVKGFLLSKKQRLELLSSILYFGVNVRYIVIDLSKVTFLLKKADDKNACYNYLIQLLVKKIINDNPSVKKINLNLDNRSSKVGSRSSLKYYLYNKLVLEQLEYKNSVKRIDFEVKYYNSKSCYLIQWADIVSNALFKKYNKGICDYYDIIKPYIVFESKFPSKDFGK